MKQPEHINRSLIVMDARYWDSLQRDLESIRDTLNWITSAIGKERYEGTWQDECLLDIIDTKARESRKLLEQIISPI